jgi:hypothetical protein
MPKKIEATVAANVASQIHVVRGQRVLLDSDLAALYGVSTSALNQAMRRNRGRFPPDFLLQITSAEWESLRSQFVILKTGRGKHRKFLPVAFTEHGAIMAATILNSPRAVEMSVYVVRAFVQLRQVFSTNAALVEKFKELEGRLDGHDAEIAAILEALRALVAPPEPKKLEIGFLADHGKR